MMFNLKFMQYALLYTDPSGITHMKKAFIEASCTNNIRTGEKVGGPSYVTDWWEIDTTLLANDNKSSWWGTKELV